MKRLRLMAFVEALQKIRASASDEQALDAKGIYREWQSGTTLTTGERVLHDGVLYTVLQTHHSQDDWTPDVSSSMFAEVLPGQDGTIGDWVQPDSTNPYMRGDIVRHNEQLWISDVDNNVWEPGVYGWSVYNA